jgi:pseudouridine synthase
LNKLLADRGVAARRKCDALIAAGHVQVDGVVVREPGTRIDPDQARVAVDGRPLPGLAARAYYALHKPTGVLTTLADPRGRPSVRDYLPTRGARVFPVGRLDGDTSGLLLVTSDGALAHRLMHPRYEIPKTYLLTLARAPSARELAQMGLGVEFAPGEVSRPAQVEVMSRGEERTVVSLTLCEGRNRQVRRMCEALGLDLLALARVRLGPIELGDQPEGTLRPLTREEVAALRRAVEQPAATRALAPGRVTPGPRRPGRSRPAGGSRVRRPTRPKPPGGPKPRA